MLDKKFNLFITGPEQFYHKKLPFTQSIELVPNTPVEEFLTPEVKNQLIDKFAYFDITCVEEWAHKNVDADFYGFMDFKKYFIFDNSDVKQNAHYDCMNNSIFEKIGFTEEKINKAISKYKVITTKPITTYFGELVTIEQFGKMDVFFDEALFGKALDIINEICPDYYKLAKKTLNATKIYRDNQFIMDKESFKAYCDWIFPILNRIHSEIDYSNFSIREMRMISILSEYLNTVYFTKLKKEGTKILELNVAYFSNAENPYLKPLYKDKIGICFATDDIYARHVGIALQSIIDHVSENEEYDIFVLDNHISRHNKFMIRETIREHKNVSLRFVKVASYIEGLDLRERDYCNKSTYLRFITLDLMGDYDRIIYLDGDIVVNTDIANLYKIDLKDNYLAAVRDMPMASRVNLRNKDGRFFRNYIKYEVGLDNIYDYFCAGIMVLNIKELKKHFTTKSLFDVALSKQWMYQDQDVLNHLCRGKVYYLGFEWDCFALSANVDEKEFYSAPKCILEEYLRAKNNPCIIHYAGQTQALFFKDVYNAPTYWKIIDKSPFHYEMLMDLARAATYVPPKEKIKLKTRIKLIFKKMFQKGSFQGRLIRKIIKKEI